MSARGRRSSTTRAEYSQSEGRTGRAGVVAAGDLAVCRATLRDGSRSFYAASRLLPRRARAPATALYAFCRVADDAVDKSADAGRALEVLRTRLDRIYAGRALRTSVERAMAAVVAEFAIPEALPAALLEGLAWDAAGRRYETLGDVRAYAVRVAGSVGAMMALIMGARSPAALARACDLGVAMQLTNIARDVGEDARAGRLYLPRAWLRAEGVDARAWLAAPVSTPAIARITQRVLAEAQRHYAHGGAGIGYLPARCRPAVRAAQRIYAAIGDQVARQGFDSVTRRAVVPPLRKLTIVIGAARAADRHAVPPPALAEAAFLLDAMPSPHVEKKSAWPADLPWWQIRGRLIWVLELFQRLEERERLDNGRPDGSNKFS